jgi:hypothetical protein
MFLVYDTVAEDVYIGDDLCEIWQVSFPEGVNKLRLKGRELNLLQFHFHTPSEHAFDGLRFPMEAHLVHRTCFSTAFGRLCSFCLCGCWVRSVQQLLLVSFWGRGLGLAESLFFSCLVESFVTRVDNS